MLAAIKTPMDMFGYAIVCCWRNSPYTNAIILYHQREAIISTFTQNAGALAAVNADWDIATDLEVQPTGDVNIQYVSANVMEYQSALGLKASAVSTRGFHR